MRHDVLFLLLAYISMMFLPGCHGDTSEQKEAVVNSFSTPAEAFDAYRQAYLSGDWQTFYFSFTPSVQRDLVFEAQLTCVVAENVPALKAIQRNFGPTEAAVGKRYWEEYKRKHGHDELIEKFLAKAIPYWESKDKAAHGARAKRTDTAPPPPESTAMDALPKDEELFRQALYDVTKDKVGFVAEVQKIDRKRGKPNTLGDLEQVTIEGETATGRAKITVVSQPGESPQKRGQSPPVYDRTFKFRKIDGGWLVDSM